MSNISMSPSPVCALLVLSISPSCQWLFKALFFSIDTGQVAGVRSRLQACGGCGDAPLRLCASKQQTKTNNEHWCSGVPATVDELVSRYTVQCTTQKQNKTPRVYKARQYTRCTCKMSSATSCSLRVPRGSYVNQERVTEKACLKALCREMMED